MHPGVEICPTLGKRCYRAGTTKGVQLPRRQSFSEHSLVPPPPPAPSGAEDIQIDGTEPYSAAALRDPYQTSPSTHCVKHKAGISPSARVSPYLERRPNQIPQQQEGALPPEPTSSQNLTASLRATRATTPFGGRTGAIPNIDPNKPPFSAFIADDDDELTATPGPEEPGGVS